MDNAAVTDAPLSIDAARAHVMGEADGACVVFEGVVRNHDGGKGVTGLSYSAHPDAPRIMGEIVAGIEAEFGVRAWAQHRVGDLAIGDAALVAACASAHRKESFLACAELVERVKQYLPVWKHQAFTDGSAEWVGLGDH